MPLLFLEIGCLGFADILRIEGLLECEGQKNINYFFLGSIDALRAMVNALADQWLACQLGNKIFSPICALLECRTGPHNRLYARTGKRNRSKINR